MRKFRWFLEPIFDDRSTFLDCLSKVLTGPNSAQNSPTYKKNEMQRWSAKVMCSASFPIPARPRRGAVRPRPGADFARLRHSENHLKMMKNQCKINARKYVEKSMLKWRQNQRFGVQKSTWSRPKSIDSSIFGVLKRCEKTWFLDSFPDDQKSGQIDTR